MIEKTTPILKPLKIRFEDLIVHEDDDYLIVNKPPFLTTLEDRLDKDNLLAMARQYVPSAQVCHRLDKETSGILVIARNPEAYRHLSIQFERRKVIKVYHAVADGLHSFNNLLVDLPLVKRDDGLAAISRKEGKPAQTYFTTLRSFKMHTLIECRPVTGRMHQIRVHLASLQAPITSDITYGGKPFLLSSIKKGYNLKKGTEEQSFIKRTALHAHRIEFEGLTGEKQQFVAPYPKDFQALIRQLERNA